MNRAIIWFRQDLRLHDNEAIVEALKYADEAVYVYVFEDKFFKEDTRFGFRRTGLHRSKFIIEAVQDLRENLRKHGAELIVRTGKAQEVIFDLANTLKCSWVYCNRERTRDELEIQDELEQKLWTIGQEIRYSRGKMLYYTQDLPFPITHTPDSFATFKKEVERIVPIRLPLEIPSDLKSIKSKIDIGNIPTLSDLGFKISKTKGIDTKSSFLGGESEGLKRLNNYLWETNLLLDYIDNKNNPMIKDSSSRFSPYLAIGCLSPKLIYHEIKKFELVKENTQAGSALIFELLWRDYFRLTGKKYGNKIFQKKGLTGTINKKWKEDKNLFKKWREGKTGVPFIDANMRELNGTGYITNKGRQNVASFLIHDLNLNWQMGAEYFESVLIDYDVCSNWGNWNYIAGLGNDPKEIRHYNILSQAKKFDPKAKYIRSWVPELCTMPDEYIYQPSKAPASVQSTHNIIIGKDYPRPMVKLVKPV